MISLQNKTKNARSFEELILWNFSYMIIVFFLFCLHPSLHLCLLTPSRVSFWLRVYPFPLFSHYSPPSPHHLPVCLFHGSHGSGAAVEPCREHLWSGPTCIIVPFAVWPKLYWLSWDASHWAPSIQRDIFFSAAQRHCLGSCLPWGQRSLKAWSGNQIPTLWISCLLIPGKS